MSLPGAEAHAVSQHMIVMVTCYERRTKRRRSFSQEEETAYELWIVVETRPAEPGMSDPELVLQQIRAADVTKRLVEGYKEAAATTAAGYVEGAIWRAWKTPDDLFPVQAINFLDGVSENLHVAIQDALSYLGAEAGFPAPINLVSANITATMLTKPLAEPMEGLSRGLEVTGILLGLVTGLHPLVITCAKYLIHGEMGDALASLFGQLEEALTTPEALQEERPIDAMEAASESSAAVPDDSAVPRTPHVHPSPRGILLSTLGDDDDGPGDAVDGNDPVGPAV